MKLCVNVPIQGWGSGTITLPEDFEDATDDEILEMLRNEEIEIQDFQIEQTVPSEYVAQNEMYNFPEKLEIIR